MSAPVLSDGVVTVRPLRAADIEPYVEAFRDDPELANLLGYDADPHPADVQRWIDATWTGPPELRSWEFSIADAADDSFSGAIMIHSCDWKNRRAETRFWLAPRARGRGTITRTLRLVLDWAFEELRLERMELTALPENEAVPRIAKRFGYVFEGTMRKRNFERGRRVDLLLWGLLHAESLDRPG